MDFELEFVYVGKILFEKQKFQNERTPNWSSEDN